MSYTKDPAAEERKRKRVDQDVCSDEVAWTAARCNRLLRTIDSRIETLRKLLRPASTNEKLQPRVRNAPKKRTHENWSTIDPMWVPNGEKRPKARAQVYSTKAKARKLAYKAASKVQLRSTNIAIPTPFIRRMRNPLDEAQSNPSPKLYTTEVEQVRRSRQLPIKHESPLQEAEAGLQTAFRSALSLTKSKSSSSRTGASSLLSSCLRRVPNYAKLEAEEMTADRDVSTYNSVPELLAYLEDMGMVEGGGWHGLREAVRALFINHIEHAISDGTLSDACVSSLIEHCCVGAAVPEGERLLQVWFDHSEVVTSEHVLRLRQFRNTHHATKAYYKILKSCARRGTARMSEITAATNSWNDLLLTTARGGSFEAIDFLETCVEVCAEQGQHSLITNSNSDPFLKNLSEVTSKLCMMAMTDLLLNEDRLQHPELCEDLHRMCSWYAIRTASKAFTFSHTWTLGPIILCLLSTNRRSRPLDALLDTFENVPKLANAAGTTVQRSRQGFASMIAKDVSALESHTGLEITHLLLRRLLDNRPGAASSIDLARRVALEAVASHKQHAGAEADVFSSELQQIMSMESNTLRPRTPHQSRRAAKFRLDEELDEWIAYTPFTKPTTDTWPATAPTSLPHSYNAHIEMQTPQAMLQNGSGEDDKENLSPEKQLDSSSDAWPSPDVLAPGSPPGKRAKRALAITANLSTLKAVVDDGLAHPQVIIPRREVERRTASRLSRSSSRLSMRHNQEESEDELGF